MEAPDKMAKTLAQLRIEKSHYTLEEFIAVSASPEILNSIDKLDFQSFNISTLDVTIRQRIYTKIS